MLATEDLFKRLRNSGAELLDLHLSRRLARLAGTDDPAIFLAVFLVSGNLSQGHVCVDLNTLAGTVLEQEDETIPLPEIVPWVDSLLRSGLAARPGKIAPLILDEKNRLYLYRYFLYERRVAEALLERAKTRSLPCDLSLMTQLDRLFPSDGPDMDWQKVAALSTATGRICVISGGPGTGKTTTVARILALLLSLEPDKKRIALAAPTGKAAGRLQQSIIKVKQKLPVESEALDALPEQATTVHRLLGALPFSPSFRHNSSNPLDLDVLVVDEASMIDLPLMAKLLDALPESCRLLLLGDKDQLASVEGGAVLSDICARKEALFFTPVFKEACREMGIGELPGCREEAPSLSDCLVFLTKSFRFGGSRGIMSLSQALCGQDHPSAIRLLSNPDLPEIDFIPCPSPDRLPGILRPLIEEPISRLFTASSAEYALGELDRFRILTPLRHGPFGVAGINMVVEHILRTLGILAGKNEEYPGKPVLILKNDYAKKLSNGDVGIFWNGTDQGGRERLLAHFPADQEVRRLAPALLPGHETSYAMTVHKSQGSEFDDVLLVLPDRDNPVLTRELLYTAVTRARRTVRLVGTPSVFKSALARRTTRHSGLDDLLWEAKGRGKWTQ